MGVPLNALANDAAGRPPVTQVKLSSKYQIVIPEDVREQLGLEPGQLFDFFVVGGVMVVVRVRAIDELFGSLPDLDTTLDREDEDRV